MQKNNNSQQPVSTGKIIRRINGERLKKFDAGEFLVTMLITNANMNKIEGTTSGDKNDMNNIVSLNNSLGNNYGNNLIGRVAEFHVKVSGKIFAAVGVVVQELDPKTNQEYPFDFKGNNAMIELMFGKFSNLVGNN